jgi:hypothetical protein
MRVLFICIAFLAAQRPLQAQEKAFLDLTNIPPKASSIEPVSHTAYSSGGGPVIIDGYPTPRKPSLMIEVQISGTKEYRIGQPIMYELRIINESTEASTVPWSVSAADVEEAESKTAFTYDYVVLTLRFRGEDGGTARMSDNVVLFGSGNKPATQLILKPGEWARIRAKAALRSEGNPRKPKLSPGSYAVSAEISSWQTKMLKKEDGWHEESGDAGPIIKSANSVLIRVQ